MRLTAPPLLLFPVLLHSSLSPFLLFFFFSPFALCHLTLNCTTGRVPPRGVMIKLLLFFLQSNTLAYSYIKTRLCLHTQSGTQNTFRTIQTDRDEDEKRSKPATVWSYMPVVVSFPSLFPPCPHFMRSKNRIILMSFLLGHSLWVKLSVARRTNCILFRKFWSEDCNLAWFIL